MTNLQRLIAAHPLVGEEPYKRIKFSGVNQHGRAVYKLGKGKTEFGAERALRTAFQRFGGNCFHCGKTIFPEELTIDHVRPIGDDGTSDLHNIVLACRRCNLRKGASDLVSFRPAAGVEYLKALDEHLLRCLEQLAKG